MRVLWIINDLKSVTSNEIRGSGTWVNALIDCIYDTNEEISLGVLCRSSKTTKIETKERIIYTIKKKYALKIKNYFFQHKHYIFADYRNDVLDVVNDFEPDLIHVHGLENLLGKDILNFGIPTVLSIQGIMSQIDRIERLALYDLFNILSFNKLAIFKNWQLNKLAMINTLIAQKEKYILQNFKHVIGRTAWDERFAKLVNNKLKYYHINEVLRNEFYYSKWDIDKAKKHHFVSVISDVPYKGLVSLIKSIRVYTCFTSEHVTLDIIGVKINSYLHKVALQMIGKIKNTNVEIRFQNNLSAFEIIRIMRNSYIYIHPSHIENSSNSICEAMMIGMPVIAFNTGGTSSIIKNDYDGILVPNFDEYAIAASINHLVNHKNIASTLGSYARERSLKRHDKKEIIQKLLLTYKELVNVRK